MPLWLLLPAQLLLLYCVAIKIGDSPLTKCSQCAAVGRSQQQLTSYHAFGIALLLLKRTYDSDSLHKCTKSFKFFHTYIQLLLFCCCYLSNVARRRIISSQRNLTMLPRTLHAVKALISTTISINNILSTASMWLPLNIVGRTFVSILSITNFEHI